MELLYGTGNQAKLALMRRALADLDLKIVGLKELGVLVPEIVETGDSPLENARIKATAYYKLFHRPVFSCDSGLYFEGLPSDLQPGVHVRRVNGMQLGDDEMIAYYSGLALRYGRIRATYRNAICFVSDESHLYESMAKQLSGKSFLLTSRPHSKRVKGFPLDSLSIDPKTGKYFYDLPMDQADDPVWQSGIHQFFESMVHRLTARANQHPDGKGTSR
ncbi:non-canonical purine NTP pyrophosphatase [Caproicibacter sp.]|uniref:non-canonical purine NTP pyrophosphatase n=1 Tax=Caproicibacter sp. TaxID=2814884 RepID=UPI0039892D2F